MAASDDGDMSADEMRRRCHDIVVRLPSISEFAEWGKRVDDAKTDDELAAVAQQLNELVHEYRRWRRVDIAARQPLTWGQQRG